jgi:hypothetical protein
MLIREHGLDAIDLEILSLLPQDACLQNTKLAKKRTGRVPAAKLSEKIPEILYVRYGAGDDCFVVKVRTEDPHS